MYTSVKNVFAIEVVNHNCGDNEKKYCKYKAIKILLLQIFDKIKA